MVGIKKCKICFFRGRCPTWKYTGTLTWHLNNAKRTLRFVFCFQLIRQKTLSYYLFFFFYFTDCTNKFFSWHLFSFFFVVQDFPDFPDEDTENSLDSNVSRLCVKCFITTNKSKDGPNKKPLPKKTILTIICMFGCNFQFWKKSKKFLILNVVVNSITSNISSSNLVWDVTNSKKIV